MLCRTLRGDYAHSKMFADFQILGSSSSGNCALIDTGNTRVLIDAGFSGKRICGFLEEIGQSIDQIDAVFLTHEHSDHAQGIRGLCRRADLPVFANRDTADAVQAKLTKRANWQVFQTGSGFTFRDLKVRSFALPHDAYDPVGFVFNWGEVDDLFSRPRSLAWATDTASQASNVSGGTTPPAARAPALLPMTRARPRTHPRGSNTCNRGQLRRKPAGTGRKAPLVYQTTHPRPPRAPVQRRNLRGLERHQRRFKIEGSLPCPPKQGLQ